MPHPQQAASRLAMDEHEDWEKVLAMKGLEIGGELMYKWIRNEGCAPRRVEPSRAQ